MRWTEILNERGEGYLYHITNADDAARILYTNTIKPMTNHPAERLGMVGSKRVNEYGVVLGASLTRDSNFSKIWRSGQGVVFVINPVRLRQSIKLRPIDYYHGNRGKEGKSGYGAPRSESEEFAIGGIPNLDRYLDEVRMSQKLFDECEEDNADYDNPQEDGRYWYLTTCPKLKII
jgi:hypothetical protein